MGNVKKTNRDYAYKKEQKPDLPFRHISYLTKYMNRVNKKRFFI